jgi:hypothetical protein
MSNNPVYWARSYFNGRSVFCNAILESEKGFIVAGNAGDPGPLAMSSAFLVMRIKSDGTIDWQKTYHNPNFRQATCIQQVGDYYFMAGYTLWEGNHAALVMKLENNGDIEWTRIYWKEQYHIIPSFMADTGDNGVVIAGRIESLQNKNQDFLVMKLDSGGKIVWETSCGLKISMKPQYQLSGLKIKGTL